MRLPLLYGAALLLSLALLPPTANAQVLDPSFTTPTSLYAPAAVYTIGDQQADGKRLVSGTFTRVNGTATSRLIRLDAAGALDVPFVQNVGLVNNLYLIRSQANGQYMLGAAGGAITAGGLTRLELLRLNANGSADPSFSVGDGPVVAGQGVGSGSTQDCVVQPNGKVVVIGYFDTFGTVAAAGVVRLNLDGSVDPTFSVGPGLTLSDYANVVTVQPDGKILIGGDFDTFAGQPAHGLVRLNANGSLDNSFVSPLQSGSYVDGLVLQPDGKILVNGNLQASGNGSLARLLPTGALDTGFSPMTQGGISAYYGPSVVVQPDGKILVINFSASNPAVYILRLNANGSLDASFQVGTGPSEKPATIGLQANGKILVGGFFYNYNALETSFVQLTTTGSLDPTFAPVLQSPGNVAAMAVQANGQVVLGGNFTEFNGQTVHRLMRLSPGGVLDASFSAAIGVLPGPVSCLAIQPDGKVLAGGRGVLRFTPSGSPDPNFTPLGLPMGTSVFVARTLALQPDGRILVGGGYNSSSSPQLIRLTTTGAGDPTFIQANTRFGPEKPYSTDALLVQPDGRIVVAGTFSPTGQPTSLIARVVRYETTGALDASFNNLSAFTAPSGTPSSGNRVYSLALQPDGKIVAGGNFGAVNGTLRYGVARLGTTGTTDASFAPNALLTGTVYNVTRQPNGRILLGGLFSNSGAASAYTNLMRVLENGQTDTSFGNTATPSGTVRSLAIQPDGGILVAGSFTTIGGQPAVGIARIVAANVLAVAAPAAVAARTTAWPVPAHGQLRVAPDASARPLSLELLDALGRPQRQQPATSAAEQTLDLTGLPAGLYLLRVHYAAGDVTRRITVE